MLLEANGAWADAETTYRRLLEENPNDQVRLEASEIVSIMTFLFLWFG